MASTVSSLAHTHLTTSKIYHTRTRQTSVNYQLDEDTIEDSANSTQGSAGSWYEVKEIIGEKKDKYKILWAGVDPQTNKPWKADWIRKSEVSAPAIAEWEESRRAKGSKHGVKLKGIQLVVQNHSPGSSSDYQPTQSAADPVVNSSPVIPLHRSAHKPWRSAPEEEDEVEDSFEYRSSPSARRRTSESPFVELSQEPASFDRAEYLKFSDLPSSQPASQNSGWGQGNSQGRSSPPLRSQSKRLFRLATLHFDIDEEIPDSQPSLPSSAYISTVEGSADPSGGTVEGGAGKVNEGDGGGEDGDVLLAEGAQPRSPWNSQDDRYGDSFTDFLGPLLQEHPAPVQGTEPGGPGGSKQDTLSTQDEGWPYTFASQPAELDRSVESSLLHPPSRSPSPYTGLNDEDIPPLSLSDSAMADQQSFHSPPAHAGSQTPSSTGKLSLRERLAQARLGFNDAVSAFRATPTRAEALPGRESPSPALSARPPLPAPQHSPLFRPTGQQASMAPSNDAQAEGKNSRASPPLSNIPPPQSTTSTPSAPRMIQNSHPRPNPSIPQSQSVNFASQLQVSLSRLPGGDHEYAPSKAALTQMNSYLSLPISPKLGPGEHVVVVGMSTGQKEAYLQNINNSSRSIQEYCNGGSQDEQAQRVISGLLRVAGRIATHLDLATNQPLDWEQQDVGYALLHPKFEFLKIFFDAIRYQSLSIAILAESGRTLDILELYLKGIKIRCRRADGFITVSQDEIDGSVNVLLCSTGPKGARVLGSYASLVIGLDSTFNIEDEQVENFRIHPLNVGRLSPVLRLVAINTVEHVMLFLPPQTKYYLPQVMSYVAILRHQAGSLPAEYADVVKESSKNIAKIIIEMSEKDVETALVTPDIPGLSIYEAASQSSTQQPSEAAASQVPIPDECSKVAPEQETPKAVSRTSSTCAAPPTPHTGDKRRWEEASQEVQVAGTEELPEKKRKVVNAPPTSSGAPDITHISDSQPTTQAPRDTQDQESSMDIDQPEQAATVVSRPVTAPVQGNTRQATKAAESSQDSAASLVIRENGGSEVTEPKDQISGEGLSGSMEGLTYDQSEQAEEVPSENQRPIIPQASTDHVPGAAASVGQESNSKFTPVTPVEANAEAVTGPKQLDSVVDESGHVVIDGNIEQDDFGYPEFEKPLKLPPELTLLELSPDQLRQLLIEKSRELHDWVKSTSRLQLRFEQMRDEVKTLNSGLKHSKDQVVSAQERMTRLNTEVINLKDERKQLKQDLQQARAALLSSHKPDVVKMEELRAQNAKFQEDVASLNRQLESTKSEVQYARDAYQEATREGGDRAKEAEELRRLNEELERKADERAVKLREVQFVNQRKVKDQQIDKLKRLLAEREERIRRLELERNSIGYKGGRPLGTRATSVPRRGSPSTSRTSSPGPGTLPGNSTLPVPAGRDHHPTRPFLSSGRRSSNNNKE